MITLNQLRREITEFATAHGQIRTAKFSRQFELQEGGDIIYPALFYDVKPMRKQKGALLRPFTFWIADLVRPDRENTVEIWNDTELMALDILAYLDSEDRDFKLQEGATITHFTLAGADLTAGVQIELTLELRIALNACEIPTTAVGYLLTENGEILATENAENITL